MTQSSLPRPRRPVSNGFAGSPPSPPGSANASVVSEALSASLLTLPDQIHAARLEVLDLEAQLIQAQRQAGDLADQAYLELRQQQGCQHATALKVAGQSPAARAARDRAETAKQALERKRAEYSRLDRQFRALLALLRAKEAPDASDYGAPQ